MLILPLFKLHNKALYKNIPDQAYILFIAKKEPHLKCKAEYLFLLKYPFDQVYFTRFT